jgi:PKD repeat protein
MYKICFALLVSCFMMTSQAQTYNYYFGNIHAHSSYSDGNKDSSSSMMTKPLQDFNYAKNAQHIDFYGICEHNHLSAGMTSPVHYHQGIADANTANIDGTFVALYGMEWGVISGGGHVIIYGYDSLMGWDANDYDVYVAQNDYASLWKKINEKPSAFAYLAHPQSDDYTNLFINAMNLGADNAIVGMAARSGPAFSTNTTYSDASTGTYIARYNDALKRGYHVGIGLDHDTHNSVFGKQTPGRLVVLAPSLTRADILDGIRNMRFYSSDDWNVKVNFTIGSKPMGSILTHTGTPTLVASVVDPDVSENVSSIAVYYGVPGSGSNAGLLTTVNSATLSYTHNITNNSTYYYYLKITQTDGNIIWTSPIWYTRNDALTNTPPLTAFSSSTTACIGQPVTFTDNSTNAPDSWSWSLPGALPNVSTHQNVVATYYTTGTYTVGLTTSNAYGAGSVVTKTITVIPLPNVTVSHATICSGETATLTASGASTYTWSNGASGASITVTPAIFSVYTVTGITNGCSKMANTFVTVNVCDVGIEEITNAHFKLYPNPANDFLMLELKDMSHEKAVEVYDMRGKLMLSLPVTAAIVKLDVSGFSSGIYLVKVISDTNNYTITKCMIDNVGR